MKSLLKKILKISGITLLVLTLMAFAIPFLFKKKITTLVKKEVNKSINAVVEFSDVDISFFRHFPRVSVALKNLSVTGTETFSKDTLISTKTFDAAINLMSFLKSSNMKIYSVSLQSPRLHLLVNKEGKANWDITKPSAPDTDSTSSTDAFTINLEKYTVENGYLYYKDETANMSAEVVGLNHSGSGNLMSDQFVLTTSTQADAAYFTYENIPYLAGNKATINSDIDVDLTTSKYSFKNAGIDINNLKVAADGFFQLENDSTYNMDINFKAPSTDFKDILSLIPAVYKQDFAKMKTGGSALFNGFVKGRYNPQQMPAYNVNLQVKDGFFQYPDLPKPVKNIQITLNAANPDGQPDNAVIDISKGHIEMDNEPFDFHVLYKNPETIKYIDAVVKGNLNLADVSKFIKLENNTKLAGTINADAFAKGNMSAIENKSGPFTAGGFFDIKNLFYSSKDFPQPVQNGNIHVNIVNNGGVADNTNIEIPAGHIELGKDPFDFTLNLTNPVTTMNFDGSVNGKFTLDNVKQFTKLEEGTSLSGLLAAAIKFKGNKTLIDKSEYDKIKTEGTATLSNVKYVAKDYPGGINIKNTSLNFNPANVSLSNLDANYLNTNFTGNGSIDNMIGYVMSNQPLTGTVNINADKMNLNDWMGTEEASDETEATSSSDPFAVPDNINLVINAKAGNVHYDKVDYKNVNGTLVLSDQTAKLQNVKTEALDGTITFNGSYSTKTNKKEPAIALSYNINDVDVQKAFMSFNTVQKLMPIGKFLAGKLSSDLSMTGSLNGNMMPDLNSLTGKGNLLLIEGVLNKFAPLEKLANTLKINELQQISVKDIKNYIEFANGKVLVKPFTVKVKDIEMEIGGLHGINQSIDYIVQMKVPRKYLGNEGNALINGLVLKANSNGVPINLGETVNLSVRMTGSISNPLIKTELKEAAGSAAEELKEQAVAFAKEKVDSVKQTVKDSLNSIKKEVANDIKDELKKQLFGNKDSTETDSTTGKPVDNIKKKAENTLKNTLDKLRGKKKTEVPDTTKSGN